MRLRIHAQFGWCLLAVATLLALGCSSQTIISPDISAVNDSSDNSAPKLTITPNYEAAQPETNIQFDLPQSGWVYLEVTNATGYHVKTLLDGEVEAGTYIISWDFLNDDGEQIGSGVYLYHLTANEYHIWSAFPYDIWPDDLESN